MPNVVFNLIVADEALLSREALLAAAKARYKSESTIARYTEYFDRLQARDLPIILSFRHLADVLGVASPKLRAMSYATSLFYRSFHIPKRSGGQREISAPVPELSMIQRWIAVNILNRLTVDLSNAAMAYVPGRSIVSHVDCHLSSRQLVKLDLRDFFPSITTSHVFDLFFDAGYSVGVARTLAALTTANGSLPQGAPSSPAISNLVLRRFDTSVAVVCDEYQLRYTRYADDIVISGELVQDIQHRVSSIAAEYGFQLNYKKSKTYLDPESPRLVTGLLIQNGRARLPKSSRRRIRAQAHYYARVLAGLLDGEARQSPQGVEPRHPADSFDDVLFPERILGRLQFWSWVEADNPYPPKAMSDLKAMLARL